MQEDLRVEDFDGVSPIRVGYLLQCPGLPYRSEQVPPVFASGVRRAL
jgi:hypothetical protein